MKMLVLLGICAMVFVTCETVCKPNPHSGKVRTLSRIQQQRNAEIPPRLWRLKRKFEVIDFYCADSVFPLKPIIAPLSFKGDSLLQLSEKTLHMFDGYCRFGFHIRKKHEKNACHPDFDIEYIAFRDANTARLFFDSVFSVLGKYEETKNPTVYLQTNNECFILRTRAHAFYYSDMDEVVRQIDAQPKRLDILW